jgi:hypothetical protein
MTSDPKPVLRTALRVLFFRASRDELLRIDHRHLTLGLVATWLVGIGRYWDSPRAGLFQKVGLGSVVYVFVLTSLLWAILWPLRPKSWSWVRLLTFVTLLSPPAALYAIPVEMFTRLETAQTLNATFLGIVAVWRVALLFWYLKRAADLPGYAVVIGSLLPLAFVVTALTILNLEHVMFDLMAGIRPEQRSSADMAYEILWFLTAISSFALPVLLIGYLALAILRFRASRRESQLPRATSPSA